jgi:predicted RNA-binding Zn ribbon-like protein
MILEGYAIMSPTSKDQAPFDLCAGHPALDFVNSLDNRFRQDGPVELLANYGDLLRFLAETQLLSTRQARLLLKGVDPGAAARALQSAKELREATAAVFYGSVDGHPPAPADIRTLERHFLSAHRHRELQWGDPSTQNSNGRPGIAWTWGRFETEAALPVWMLSQAASDLMMSEEIGWVRACGVDTCRWLFLDTSKNHTRRWCDMKVCGNRMKARRFQARQDD